jgi:hypothetical protein
VATSALLIIGLFWAAAGAEAAPSPGQVGFSTPTLFPTFGPAITDYVVRCNNGPVTVQGYTSGGWEAAIGHHPFRSGDFSEVVPLSAGRAFAIIVRDVGRTQLYRYFVRCLPNSFPNYTYIRYGPVSPRYFSVSRDFTRRALRYGIIFDNHGVPVWWVNTPAWDTRVLPNGNILWYGGPPPGSRWETHRLDGSLVRTFHAVGPGADGHDLQLLGNGHFLVGAYVNQQHVDTSGYGGSRDATVVNTLLEEVGPSQGALFWAWKSQQHIARSETGRNWPRVIGRSIYGGYDILHWNSIEPAGSSVIASFRNLDAVYKIERSAAGRIIWKLGGTRTPDSLQVRNDPRAYTLGAQHDARLLPDGTVTVFDNRTYLEQPPRAVRFRIDEQSGTATLLQSITDSAVSRSGCCGSARRLANGDWLIGWGGPSDRIGGYKPNGQRTFSLHMHTSYRAEPVPGGVLSAQAMRQGMNAMYGAP